MNTPRFISRALAVALLATLVSPLTLTETRAVAADEFRCDAQPEIYAHNPREGKSYLYPTADFGTTSARHLDRREVAADVNGHIIRAGKGILYSWADKNLYRHTYKNGAFVKSGPIPSPDGSLGGWGITAETPLAVDALNNIYLLDGNILRRYSFTEDGTRWTTMREEVPLPANLTSGIKRMFASEGSKIYIVDSQDRMFSFTYDAVTHRSSPAPAEANGYGWGEIRSLSSAGGGTVFGQLGGGIILYRKGEPGVFQHMMGHTGWEAYDTVQMMQGVCKSVPVPTKRSVNLPQGMAAVGDPVRSTADFAGVNKDARAFVGHVKDSTVQDFGRSVAWTTVSGAVPVTGRPAFLPMGDGTYFMATLDIRGRVNLTLQKKDGSWPQGFTTYDVGGDFVSAPITASNSTSRAIFAVDASGDLWASVSPLSLETPFTSWTRVTEGLGIDPKVALSSTTQVNEVHLMASTKSGIVEITFDLTSKTLLKAETLTALPMAVTPRGLSFVAVDSGMGTLLMTSTEGKAYIIGQNVEREWDSSWANVPLNNATIEGIAALSPSPLAMDFIVARTKATEPGGTGQIITAAEDPSQPRTFPLVLSKTPETRLVFDPMPVTLRLREGVALMAATGNGSNSAELWQLHTPMPQSFLAGRSAKEIKAKAQVDLKKVSTFRIG